MVRLFEFVTLENNYLPDQFKTLEEPTDEKNSLKIMYNFKLIDKERLYEATCPYDVENRCIFKFDGNLSSYLIWLSIISGKFAFWR